MAFPLAEDFRDQRGVTYLMLMFAIVLIGLSLSIAAKQWKMVVQRELEADLLAKGIEIQNALQLYSTTMKAGRVIPGEVYPQSLADLTRLPKPYLRKVYFDPVGRGDWEYVRAPGGGIMGVRSKSRAKPIRRHDFPLPVRHFENLQTYRDWVFQYPSQAQLLGVGQPRGQFPEAAPSQPGVDSPPPPPVGDTPGLPAPAP